MTPANAHALNVSMTDATLAKAHALNVRTIKLVARNRPRVEREGDRLSARERPRVGARRRSVGAHAPSLTQWARASAQWELPPRHWGRSAAQWEPRGRSVRAARRPLRANSALREAPTGGAVSLATAGFLVGHTQWVVLSVPDEHSWCGEGHGGTGSSRVARTRAIQPLVTLLSQPLTQRAPGGAACTQTDQCS